MAAAGIAVSVSLGAMKPVLEKLAALMGDKYKKLKGLQKEVSFLMDELSDMKALLEKMEEAVDELDSQAKKWRKDIIEMSYDIEDRIDDFMDRVSEVGDKQVGILKKASHYLTTIKDQYRIANQINEIKTRVIEASQRRERYNLDVCTSSTNSPVAVDPRLSALYKDSTSLVGINTQKEELVKWAMDERQRLKIMSIVGFGGLGKTTLANEVYRGVAEHFNSMAFVPISQKPDIARLLNSVHSKLGLQSSSHAREVQELIDNLRKHLQDKRYFIVLDDLWNVQDWDIISCAFPQNNKQSRLIVTTRIEGVAQACRIDNGCIHYMKRLSDVDSRKLFFRRIFGTEDTCPPQFTQVSLEILKKCGGLPLAIVTMASTLACQPIEQWEYTKRSVVTESAANSMDDMMRILDLSYKHLPHHLRACFLYLAIYPEDYEIKSDDLIDLWVAERIVMNKSPGQDVRDVAKTYFNELVMRNMIQPQSYCYKVHDMMLDLILKRCREDNFVSVVHSAQVVVEWRDRVRRLSVSLNDADDDTILVATKCCQSQVRSLVSFGASKWMPPLLELMFLRVLYLDFPKYLMRMDLTSVGQLSHLRYLRIEAQQLHSSKCSIVLPSEIRRMQHLERLLMPDISICNIPSDIVDLPLLSHLILPPNTTSLPDGIGKLKSLHSLGYFGLAKSSPDNIKGLGKLNKLKVLGLVCQGNDTPTARWMEALIFSLEKLSNLKFFSLTSDSITTGADALSLLSPPFHNLEELCLEGVTFSRVPRWIGGLQKLRNLTLGVKQMPQEDIGIIGTLPSLRILFVRIPGVPTDKVLIGRSTGFTALDIFDFDCDVMSYLTFEDGAMPSLQELQLALDSHEWDKAAPLGLQYLLSLKKITVWQTVCNHSSARTDDKETEEMSSAALVGRVFQEAANTHPSQPVFSLDWCKRRRRQLGGTGVEACIERGSELGLHCHDKFTVQLLSSILPLH